MDYLYSGSDARRPMLMWSSLGVLATVLAVTNVAAITAAQSCGGTYNAPGGEITSPNYPRRHPTRKMCVYHIIRPVEGPMMITFPEFHMQPPEYGKACDVGYLKVYDGNTTEAPLLATYCGKKARTIHSSSNAVTISFYAIDWRPGYGFRIEYGNSATCESKGGTCRPNAPCLQPTLDYCENGASCCTREAGCGDTLSGGDGIIKSPNFPEDYRNNIDCIYTIDRPHAQVALKFKEFDMEDGTGCYNDYVVAYDGPDVNAPVIGSRFCGNEPHNLLSSSEYLTLHFHTNAITTKKGFMAVWREITSFQPGCDFWEEQCRIGSCNSLSYNRCPDQRRCCQEACDLTMKKICHDGACTHNNVSCNPASLALPKDAIRCPLHAHRCPDGSCIFGEYDCGCTMYRPHSCDEGERCYRNSEKCDGVAQCHDKSDESDCADPTLTGLIAGLVLGGSGAVLCCCLYCLCCRKKKGKQAATSGSAYLRAFSTDSNAPLVAHQASLAQQISLQNLPPTTPAVYPPEQPGPFPPGQKQPFPPGSAQPQAGGSGQQQPYAQPYPGPQPQASAGADPMVSPSRCALPSYGANPPMGATASAAPGQMVPQPDNPPPYDAVAWSSQPQDQSVTMLKSR